MSRRASIHSTIAPHGTAPPPECSHQADTESHLKPDRICLNSDTCWHRKPDSDSLSVHPYGANDAEADPPRRIVEMCDVSFQQAGILLP